MPAWAIAAAVFILLVLGAFGVVASIVHDKGMEEEGKPL